MTALPVKCPSAKPLFELSPQFKEKGAADEQIYEIIACIMALSIQHSMDSEIPIPYHAAAVESDEHLARCIAYIDANMVRAGVVSHPF